MAITKKKNGKYQVRVYVGYDKITGKRKTKYVTCETMREARLKEAQLITDVETGELVPEWDKAREQRHMTFDEAYEEWFDIYKRQGRTNATIGKTRYFFEHYLLKPSLFGGIYLDRMTRRDVQQRVNKFIPQYASSKEILSYAKMMLKWAVDNDEIACDDNPMDHIQMVKAKKAPKRKTKYYDEHQVNLFESGMNEYWGRKHLDLITLFTLLIHTGARFGEVIGLHWSDIDYNEQRITFGGRVSHINGGGRSEYLDGLKNGDDFKVVEVDQKTLSTLKAFYNQENVRVHEYGDHLQADDLIFSHKYAFQPYKDIYYKDSLISSNLRGYINWYNKHHDEQLPYLNIHGFRHTHASLLLSNGVELKKVADRLGHKDITVTANIYADVTPKAKREVADKFSEILSNDN
ncbi:tyrosine-type recombinase/integrase [Weissella viridescens]|mgnify:CR=1 FL=1|jgi:integrase|uniref:tyrosine-type recombinase/integrase n=1 Tax=Weissella viridescens TaxID=1629 RepID=UPI00174791B3|nr:site-specific integrase [Weissella viridescens]MBX4172099.1 site-specific integrase [Weissella viridescens]MCB6839719.1 site-specific integrase [Weissella viridescens]MCB6846451.1 site-specific integrase [Weissella viridescens]QOD85714.1 site-specific integrase [Weissella viridescens]